MGTPTPLDRLRTVCSAFPEVTERLSHGAPTWFVRDKDEPRPRDHETITYDMAEWNDQQRRTLELLLTGAAVAYGWEGVDLTVPESAEATVDGLIEEVEALDEEGRPG
jgi:hypothetical protein